MINNYFQVVLIATALRFTIMDHDNKILNKTWEYINSFMKTKNKGIQGYYNKLIGCPFCNGFWFGLIVYSINQLYIHESFNLLNGFFVGISTGLFSYLLSDIISFFYLYNFYLKQQLGINEKEENEEEYDSESVDDIDLSHVNLESIVNLMNDNSHLLGTMIVNKAKVNEKELYNK